MPAHNAIPATFPWQVRYRLKLRLQRLVVQQVRETVKPRLEGIGERCERGYLPLNGPCEALTTPLKAFRAANSR
ncbi:hypothetical protein SBA5_50029 [Candidatus Sulfotelmatomonas gaucii]|uniref:Uncharacterized protein n=1 Tax=Candidatus Sulfuritelmatomonas gaucii TaxID=2043161 RepID=A0A2N9LQD0_9BACT|nr:hypothetical protein SBA5_50029 [Candidatus Sulfotelmatomonas gaucii]